MPRLKFSFLSPDPLVTTSGQVIRGAGSPGQQVCIGNKSRLMSWPLRTTSWTGAFFSVLGRIARTSLARGSSDKALFKLSGGAGFCKKASASPISLKPSGLVFSAAAIRPTLPNRFTRTGIPAFLPCSLITFSNNIAGPRSAIMRVWISVISRLVETGSVTRTRSPDCSRALIKSLREVNAISRSLHNAQLAGGDTQEQQQSNNHV